MLAVTALTGQSFSVLCPSSLAASWDVILFVLRVDVVKYSYVLMHKKGIVQHGTRRKFKLNKKAHHIKLNV